MGVSVRMIVSDDERTCFARKNNPSSSCGIFGNLCDGVIIPPQSSRTGSTRTQWCIVVSESSHCVVYVLK